MKDKWSPRENKKTIELLLFSKLPFLSMYWKKSAHPLLAAWSFLLVHIQFTPSEGPNNFVNQFFKNMDHEMYTMNLYRVIRHLTWDEFMVYGVNRPFCLICTSLCWFYQIHRGCTLKDFCIPRAAEGYLFRSYLPTKAQIKSSL